MATTAPLKNRIKELKIEYDTYRKDKDALLTLINEVELSESVFNSNAIENSTLTLKETEKILLDMEVSRDVSLREVFEAKNLAIVMEYINTKAQDDLSQEKILLLHKMLIGNIDESIAGRFRKENEYVRVGSYIAPAPEHVNMMLEQLLLEYSSNNEFYFVDNIAKFHLDFENIHPFNDGNGRIGRVIINYQLLKLGFPGIIIRDKEKKEYYKAFNEYRENKKANRMQKFFSLALMESMHKRITYLKGESIVLLSDYAKTNNKSIHSLINAARRQTIPAFREKAVWKIGAKAII
jgi:Fic family protein